MNKKNYNKGSRVIDVINQLKHTIIFSQYVDSLLIRALYTSNSKKDSKKTFKVIYHCEM